MSEQFLVLMQVMWEKVCTNPLLLTVSAGSCNWRHESSSAPGGGRLPSLHSCVYASPPSPVFPAHDIAAAETHSGPCSWEGGGGGRGKVEEVY